MNAVHAQQQPNDPPVADDEDEVSEEQLDDWARNPVDCLLVPLQGNSRINEIGARIVEKLRPESVIPHHHDDFYPPISRSIDISKFRKIVKDTFPSTRILELEMGRPHLIHVPGKGIARSISTEFRL